MDSGRRWRRRVRALMEILFAEFPVPRIPYDFVNDGKHFVVFFPNGTIATASGHFHSDPENPRIDFISHPSLASEIATFENPIKGFVESERLLGPPISGDWNFRQYTKTKYRNLPSETESENRLPFFSLCLSFQKKVSKLGIIPFCSKTEKF